MCAYIHRAELQSVGNGIIARDFPNTDLFRSTLKMDYFNFSRRSTGIADQAVSGFKARGASALCKEPRLELQFDKHIRFIMFTLVFFA